MVDDPPPLVLLHTIHKQNAGLTVVVTGASGDLAKKMTYPCLFALYRDGLLPPDTIVWGYARSKKTHQSLRDQLRPFLVSSLKGSLGEEHLVDGFLSCCYYKSGSSYGDDQAWTELVEVIEEHEDSVRTMHKVQSNNRLFYFAIPPERFGETGVAIRKTALQDTKRGWSRIILEKPFGRDLESYEQLSSTLSANFQEEHLYRIDHYLGKEVVQNLLLWRFGNSVWEWMWHRDAIESIKITFKEPFGTQGRGGYFDNYGIIRDIQQNHLLQVLALLAMEPPVRADGPGSGDYVRDAKTRVLQAMPPIEMDDCLLGQYDGYADDETIVDKNTNTPTYAALRCFVNTPRWAGVPFLLEAGKALDDRVCEVRVVFRESPAGSTMFPNRKLPRNELVMRIQPDPVVQLVSNMKEPGFSYQPQAVPMTMDYRRDADIGSNNPQAYTRLILDVLRGRQGSFVRTDELRRSWEIFSPLLHQIEGKGNDVAVPVVHKYPQGSEGPTERAAFLHRVLGSSSRLTSAL